MMIVEKNTVVGFRYIMKDNRGQVVENTMEGSPKYYLHGSAGIQASLQIQFEGLKVGDVQVVHLKKGVALSNKDFTFQVVIDDLRPAVEEESMLGYPVVIDDLICDSQCVCYNVE